MSNAVTVVIPQDLREQARDYRMNISEVCRTALKEAIEKKEREVRERVAKRVPGTATPELQGA